MIFFSGLVRRFVILFLIVVAVPTFATSEGGKPTDFDCGASVHQTAVRLWRSDVRPFIRDELTKKRLVSQGDVYALYDMQTFSANFLAMARRCGNRELLDDLAKVLHPTFSMLEIDKTDGARKWICRGGAICNEKNKLLNSEVMLDSVQFLALSVSLANAISTIPLSERSESMQNFLSDTGALAIEHIARWWRNGFGLSVRAKMDVLPADVMNGASRFFFSDKDLWIIAIVSDLAGVAENDPNFPAVGDKADWAEVTSAAQSLFKLLKRRVSFLSLDSHAVGGDLDRGFWRLYADNRYAGYVGQVAPVRCVESIDENGKIVKKIEVLQSADQVALVSSGGWDISHARRLVHAFDSVLRNKENISNILGVDEDLIPNESIVRAFENTLIYLIWNRDEKFPLFSNYWDGSNGWFRVAYDNGTGSCREGYPPYGLTDAFATGGFASWRTAGSTLINLGRRLFLLYQSSGDSDREFMQKYYPGLTNKVAPSVKARTEFMFLPSLVGNAQ